MFDFAFWSVIVSYLIVNGLLSFIVGFVAKEKGRSSGSFYALSFFTSFFIGILVVLAIPKNDKPLPWPDTSTSHAKCETCKELILRDAIMCRFCGTSRTPTGNAPLAVRSWCPRCKTESEVLANSACPSCGAATHPW